MLTARAYRDAAQLTLTIDTASLVDAHSHDIRLTRINSGAVVYVNGRRGAYTFRTVQRFDHPRHRPGSSRRAVVELTVMGGVPDVMDHLIRAERWEHGAMVEALFDRSA